MRLADTKVSQPPSVWVILTQHALTQMQAHQRGMQQKLRSVSVNQQNISPHCNTHMFSVLKVTPGSIRVDIPSPSSGLAADVAAK